MAKPLNSKRTAPCKSPTSRTSTQANGQVLDRLRAQKKMLLASMRALKKERDAYRRAVYAWAEEQLTREDLAHLASSKEGLPLSDFIGELEREIERQ